MKLSLFVFLFLMSFSAFAPPHVPQLYPWGPGPVCNRLLNVSQEPVEATILGESDAKNSVNEVRLKMRPSGGRIALSWGHSQVVASPYSPDWAINRAYDNLGMASRALDTFDVHPRALPFFFPNEASVYFLIKQILKDLTVDPRAGFFFDPGLWKLAFGAFATGSVLCFLAGVEDPALLTTVGVGTFSALMGWRWTSRSQGVRDREYQRGRSTPWDSFCSAQRNEAALFENEKFARWSVVSLTTRLSRELSSRRATDPDPKVQAFLDGVLENRPRSFFVDIVFQWTYHGTDPNALAILYY